MAEPTPHPWEARWDTHDKEIGIYPKDSMYPLANVDYDDVDHMEAEANAILIMKAPWMFEVLKRIANAHSDVERGLMHPLNVTGAAKEQVDSIQKLLDDIVDPFGEDEEDADT